MLAICSVMAWGRGAGRGARQGAGSCSCLPRSAAAVRDLARRRRWRGRRTTATGKKLQRRELCGLHFGHWAVASWHEHAHVVAVEQDLRARSGMRALVCAIPPVRAEKGGGNDARRSNLLKFGDTIAPLRIHFVFSYILQSANVKNLTGT